MKSERTDIDYIPYKESLPVYFIGFILVLSTWFLAGTSFDSQISIFLASIVSIISVILLQRFSFPKQPLKQVLKPFLFNPVFWFGLLLLLYILIQAINPAYELAKTDYENIPNRLWKFTHSFILVPIEHIGWLPSSISVPFSERNTFHVLIIFASLFCFAFTLLSLRHIRLAIATLVIASVNATVLALLGILLRFSGSRKILGIFDPTGSNQVFGPFNYVNQAAAFHCMGLAISLALYFYFQREAKKRMLRSGPYPIFLICAFLNLAAVAMTLSQGGIVIAASILLCFFLLLFTQGFMQKNLHSFFFILAAVVAIPVLGFLTIGQLNMKAIQKEIKLLDKRIEKLDDDIRSTAYKTTFKMFEDKAAFGWGAGCFQYAFSDYQVEEPKLMAIKWSRTEKDMNGKNIRKTFPSFWNFAHNDWLELLAELGIVGAGIMILPFISFLYVVMRNIRLLRPFHIMLIVGIIGLCIEASFDALFQSTGILLYFITMMASIVVILQRRRKFL